MSVVCMELAVRHAQTLKAATPAAVWRAISCSQTTAPAKPKMVRGVDRNRQSPMIIVHAEPGNGWPKHYAGDHIPS